MFCPLKAPTNAKYARCVRRIAFAIVALLPASTAGQTQLGSIIQGSVRNSSGVAVTGATITLTTENGTSVQAAKSDSQGAFRFSAMNPGKYSLRAWMDGYEDASSEPFTLENGESKSFTLVLKTKFAASDTPQFSDEPSFAVAGVADATNLGGHGSDVIVRNRQAVAKATIAMGNNSPAVSSTPPHTNEETLRRELDHDPRNYAANLQLGKLLLREGKPREAISYLERGKALKPGEYEDEYELALAHAEAGNYEVAAAAVRSLLKREDKAELRHLMAVVDEKQGNPLEAVSEYQRASELDASEENLFDWGTELLLHQAAEPAIEVFTRGNRLFPASVRMLTALGAAWYVRGSSDQAVRILCQASDLDPNAETPYLFLGRIQKAEPAANEESLFRLQRFAQSQPNNAQANYFYAIALWKQYRRPQDDANLLKIESLLKAATTHDPKFASAYLQLGILYSEQKKPEAIAAYEKAVEIAPELPEAHYRLAQAYRKSGDKVKAQQQLQLYQQASKKAAEDVERERHEIRQFVFTMRDEPSTNPQ